VGSDVISRRAFAGVSLIAASGGLGEQAPSVSGEDARARSGLSPDAALARLKAGNNRYAAGRQAHPDVEPSRRVSLEDAQYPFATILTCSDSRVAPEILFDQGLGSLFVVRVAGNVVDDAVLGSIEYSVLHLGSPVVMVLGHQNCGPLMTAMAAADGRASGQDTGTQIGAFTELMAPAIRGAPEGLPDRLQVASLLNAQRQAAQILARSRQLHDRVAARTLRVVSARYWFDSGKVTDLHDA
jgi:carbonic anhydrase